MLLKTSPIGSKAWLRMNLNQLSKLNQNQAAEVEEAAVAEDIPDWLQGLTDEESGNQLNSDEPEPVVEDEVVDVPEWVESPVDDKRIETFPTGVTGWLGDLNEEEIAETNLEYEPGELPSWLEGLGKKQVEDEVDSERIIEESVDGEIETGKVSDTEEETEDLIRLSQEMDQDVMPETQAPPDTDQELEEIHPPDLSDADAAMAWLESLAAKQGVSEEELITRPEDRTDTPPDWVSEIVDDLLDDSEVTIPSDEVSLPLSDDEISSDWISEISEESEVRVEDAEALFGSKPISDEELKEIDISPEEAISWLESLADSEIQLDPSKDTVLESPIKFDDSSTYKIDKNTIELQESPAILELQTLARKIKKSLLWSPNPKANWIPIFQQWNILKPIRRNPSRRMQP